MSISLRCRKHSLAVYIFLWIYSTILFQPSESHKVLLMPGMMGSHVIPYGSLGESLIRNGHQVFMIAAEGYKLPPQLLNKGIKFITYQTSKEQTLASKDLRKMLTKYDQLTIYEKLQMFHTLMNISRKTCAEILENELLYENLEKEKFDFAIVDIFLGLQCWYAVPHRLGVPYGTLIHQYSPLLDFSLTLQTIHLTPSQITIPYPEKPNNLHRITQILVSFAMNTGYYYSQDWALITKYTRTRPLSRKHELAENVQLWLLDVHIGHDARSSPPNIVELFGLTCRTAQVLPKDIFEFAESAEKGLVVVAFGSQQEDFPLEIPERILKGLNLLEQRVIMSTKTKALIPVREGIMLLNWLPQQDLLAQKNTVLFVTIGGANSINVAVCHGVPILALPCHTEQMHNAKRAALNGYGLFLNRKTFTPKDFYDSVNELVRNPSYKKKIQRASEITKSGMMPAGDTAVYWIDHVIKHGGQHLKPYSLKLKWYEILMLDIAVTILVILAVVVVLTWKCVVWVIRTCCKRSTSQEKSKTK